MFEYQLLFFHVILREDISRSRSTKQQDSSGSMVSAVLFVISLSEYDQVLAEVSDTHSSTKRGQIKIKLYQRNNHAGMVI